MEKLPRCAFLFSPPDVEMESDLMYLEHYGFSEKPFTITPNPRFIFLSKNHREVFAHLLYGIRQHAGFIELTGEVGTGKTTVLRTLLSQLEQDPYRLAFIFNPSLSAPELMRSIGEEFGLEMEGASGTEMLSRINRFLLEENAAGRTVVLVIDEAQNLAPEVLEQIRLLSNLETETDKLIQIILVGQPELGHLLEQPALRQVSQRITVRYHLRPMDFEDTQAYVAHRLRVAGACGPVFSPQALRKVYAYSKGFPRLINIVCDRSLLVGYSEEVRVIDAAQVATAVRELHREIRPRWFGFRPRPAWAIGAVALSLVGALLFWSFSQKPPESPPRAAQANATSASPAASPSGSVDRVGRVHEVLAAIPESENAALAFNAIAHLWGERPVRMGGKITMPGELIEVAQRRGLEVEFLEGSLDTLLKLNYPAIVQLEVPGGAGWRYLALLSMVKEQIAVAPNAAGGELQVEDLRRLWSGRAWILWKNPLRIPAQGGVSYASHAKELHQMLRESGMLKESSGPVNEGTLEAVARFQQSRGIVPDGKLGPQTLMLLYQASPRYSTPRVSPVLTAEEKS